MNDNTTSLDHLHDLAMPEAVSWWPLAPGWYVIAGIVLVLALVLVHRGWKKRQANAYCRAALRDLNSVKDVAAVAELLRRTALVIAPRSMIADKTGTAWLEWLAAHSPEAMPDVVREQLTAGVYGRPGPNRNVSELRDFAARWISHHRVP